MKKMSLFLPLLVTSLILHPSESKQASDHKVELESPVIKVADGSFINADTIEFMRKFRRTLLSIILGEQLPDGTRKGNGIQALAYLEQELKEQKQTAEIATKLIHLKEQLTKAKAHFIIHSTEFMDSGRGSKNILVVLIQEDCQKRNRPDSLLLEWARTKEGYETTMFEQRITTFGEYYSFCTDLVNFLLDLIHSCPKAEMQFKDRVTKWSAVKKILPIMIKKAHIKSDSFDEIEFLKYLKERYIDKIVLDDITPQTILPLLVEYVKHTPTTHG